VSAVVSMMVGGHERVAYTVEHRGNCVLIHGDVPASAFAVLSQLASPEAVMDPDVARMYGVTFAMGMPDDLEALRSAGVPAAEQHIRASAPGLSEDAVHWLAGGERGMSSEAIFTFLTGIDCTGRIRLHDLPRSYDHPYDPGDFRRCRLLLEQVPELVPLFPRMAGASPQWSALVHAWPAICATMDAECPSWRGASEQYAHQTYELIKKAIGR